MDRTASDTVLNIWRQLCVKGEEVMPLATFTLCAEAWERIRKMEEAMDSRERTMKALLQAPPVAIQESTPIRVEKVHPDEGKKVHVDASKKYAGTPTEDEGDDTSSAGQSPAPSPQGEGKKHPWDTYRTNCQSRLLITQFSTEQIVRAGGGAFTTNDVRAFADDMRAIKTPVIAAIMSAMDKLEGKA